MCYLVTGINTNLQSYAGRLHSIHDTEDEARTVAEKVVREGYTEVAIWKQLAVPRVETNVVWE